MLKNVYFRKICFLAILFVSDPVSALEIRKLSDEAVLLIGQIVAGDYDKIIEYLSSNRQFPIQFTLVSEGGNVAEAMRIGRLFRDAKIVVEPISCNSACFLLWAGSPVRQGALDIPQFELHRPFFDPGTYQGVPLDQAVALHEAAEEDFSAYLLDMGVPSYFIDRILTYRSSDSYEISGNELAGIVGRRARAVEEILMARCGELTDAEAADLRRVRSYQSAQEALDTFPSSGDPVDRSIYENRYRANQPFVSSLSQGYIEYLQSKNREVLDCEGQILFEEQVAYLRGAGIINF